MDATHLRTSRRRWLLGLLLLAALFFVPLPRELRGDRTLSRASDLAHLPLLAIITFILHARGPLRGRLASAAGAALAIAVLIEAGQAFTGRMASLVDVAIGAVGIACGAAWAARRALHPRWRILAAVAAVAAVAALGLHLAPVPRWKAAEAWARHSFPLLSDFEANVELANWDSSHGAILTPVETEPEPGSPAPGRALRVRMGRLHSYPGAELTGFPRDWRGRTALQWLARAPGAEAPLRFGVRLDDAPGRAEDWASGSFRAGPEWQRYEIDLVSLRAQSGRPLELRAMISVLFYLPAPPPGAALELDDVRLR